MKNAKVKKSGTLDNFSLEPMEVKDYFGFEYHGYIYVPQKDLYTFCTRSDDGSVLIIDGKEIVNNDGYHSASTVSNVTALNKGYHEFIVLYFEGAVDNSLVVGWSHGNNEPSPIPAKNLFRKK